jgi:transcriptional regulator with XRE-family HTH domain
MQDPLLTQLASRTRTFSRGSGISLNKIARLCGMEPSNFSNFINGKIGLSAAATIKLYQLLGLTKHEVEMKLGKVPLAQIQHFQTYGKPMTLDDNDGAWVPGQSGQDPATSSTIVDDDDSNSDADDYAAETRAFLKSQLGIHRSAIRAIKTYLGNEAAKAQVNQ